MSFLSRIGRTASKAAGAVAGAATQAASSLAGGSNEAQQSSMSPNVILAADRQRPRPPQRPPPRPGAPIVSESGPTTQIGADEHDIQNFQPMPAIYHPPAEDQAPQTYWA